MHVIKALKRYPVVSGCAALPRRTNISTFLIEPKKTIALKPPVASYPPGATVPGSFATGPVFVTHMRNGYVEPRTGFAFSARRDFIRETAMNGNLVDELAERFDKIDFDNAAALAAKGPVFVISNQRSANYCRWWLDVVSKFYLFDRAQPFHGVNPEHRQYIAAPPSKAFQGSTLAAIGARAAAAQSDLPLVRGDLYLTSGLTYGGGQNISAELVGFRDSILRQSQKPDLREHSPTAPRLYISRARTPMRRLLNEAELFDTLLAGRGFVKTCPEDLTVARQIELFRKAEIIVSPHGAGLTNIMFCRPGTKLLEIFPLGGLHSSAFMRMATLLDISYAYFCGESVANRASAKNPNNADIICDPVAFGAFFDKLLRQWA